MAPRIVQTSISIKNWPSGVEAEGQSTLNGGRGKDPRGELKRVGYGLESRLHCSRRKAIQAYAHAVCSVPCVVDAIDSGDIRGSVGNLVGRSG